MSAANWHKQRQQTSEVIANEVVSLLQPSAVRLSDKSIRNYHVQSKMHYASQKGLDSGNLQFGSSVVTGHRQDSPGRVGRWEARGVPSLEGRELLPSCGAPCQVALALAPALQSRLEGGNRFVHM